MFFHEKVRIDLRTHLECGFGILQDPTIWGFDLMIEHDRTITLW